MFGWLTCLPVCSSFVCPALIEALLRDREREELRLSMNGRENGSFCYRKIHFSDFD